MQKATLCKQPKQDHMPSTTAMYMLPSTHSTPLLWLVCTYSSEGWSKCVSSANSQAKIEADLISDS